MEEPSVIRTGEAPLLSPDPVKKAKRDYRRIGFALCVFIGAASAMQIAAQTVLSLVFPAVTEQGWYIWALSFIPLYLFGFPLSLLLFFSVPAERPEKKTMPLYEWLAVLTVSIFLMYAGNLIGNLVNLVISQLFGAEAATVVNMLDGTQLYFSAPAVVIVAPVMEELICRKLLLDRTRRYGEVTAAVFSAVSFGLIHGNFTQFFYAFALGLVFSWVYLRTGRVIYTMLLHASINLLGGVIGPLILSKVDPDALSADDPEEILSYLLSGGLQEMLPVYFYVGVLFSLALIGAILLLAFRKKIVFRPASEELPRGKVFSVVYLNAGTILFVVICMGLFVLAFFQ